MGGRKKKRNHTHFSQDESNNSNLMGVGAALASLRAPSDPDPPKTPDDGHSDSGEWQTVSRAGKRQKKANYPSLGFSDSYRMQAGVKLSDLQGLILYCLADGPSPQWVAVRHHTMVKKAVILFVPGLERGMFDESVSLGEKTESTEKMVQHGNGERNSTQNVANETPIHENHSSPRPQRPSLPDDYLPSKLDPETMPVPLKPLADGFTHLWPIKAPGDDQMSKVHSPLQAILQSPVPKTQEEKRALKEARGVPSFKDSKSWENKRTRVSEYLLSSEDLQEQEYVLHPVNLRTAEERDNLMQTRIKKKQSDQDGWVDSQVDDLSQATLPESQIQQGSVSAGRDVLSMDCEMCRVEGGELALTRISLVDWNGRVVIDELVKPDKPIIDYLTQYSGMTAEKLDPVRTTLPDIQKRLLSLLHPLSILVGHSLNSDLSAIKLTHPFIIDTSCLYPHPRGPPLKSSLKWLTQKYLSREIQKGHGVNGHDSIEDARACLDLVKLKCEKGPLWGTSEAANESIFKRLKRTPLASSMHDQSQSRGKEGAIIDHGYPEQNFGAMASYCIGCSSDAEVVAATKRAVLGDPDGAYVPGGGVSFTWARLRELEHHRGWRNDEHTIPQNSSPTETTPSPTLASVVSRTVAHVLEVRKFLPPCTLLIVYTGTGDPREMARLNEMKRTYQREFKVKKWDELSVRWTDVEEQALRGAARKARDGMGLICIT